MSGLNRLALRDQMATGCITCQLVSMSGAQIFTALLITTSLRIEIQWDLPPVIVGLHGEVHGDTPFVLHDVPPGAAFPPINNSAILGFDAR